MSASQVWPQMVNAGRVYKDGAGLNVEPSQIDEEAEKKILYSFITKNYSKISTADAKLISETLVISGKENQVDPKFTAALISRESAFNRQAISVTGAKGLGQIKDFNFESLKITDPYDIKQNAAGTTAYIKQMLTLWKDKSKKVALSLASYFKGYGAVKRSNESLDDDAKGYVHDIVTAYESIKSVKF